MFVYLECSTLWTLCQWTGPSQYLQYIILDLNSGLYGDQLWRPFILIWPTSGLHNLDTIFLTYHRVSPTLWVVMKFYNCFTNSHCVMFIYLECGTSWTLCHRTGPSQCLQYIILDLNSGLYGDQLWRPFILTWLTSGLQSWYNLPNVSQNFSDTTSDHDVLQQFHLLTLCHVHVSGMWHIINPFVTGQGHQWILLHESFAK
jgi:hypothetical protein